MITELNAPSRANGASKIKSPALARTTLERSKVVGRSQEWCISLRSKNCDELSIFDNFPPAGRSVAGQMVFGDCAYYEAARARMNGADWPVLWVQGDVGTGKHITGVQTFTIAGQSPRRILRANRVVGSTWSDKDADYCLLAGILPAQLSGGRGVQTQSCFEEIEASLHQAGLDFSHVVRTWLYLDDLLGWYDEFNAARTEFFQSRGVLGGLVPASTGIGACNPAGAPLVAGALAIRPRLNAVHIQEVVSPFQCSATAYRSSFSRAVEIAYPNHWLLTVSGTASIAPGGKSLHGGDVEKQIELTLDVVGAILESRGMNWRNATRAIAYFRNIGALPLFESCCNARGIAALPCVPVQATVCRSDLLFELELDAVLARGRQLMADVEPHSK